MHLVSNQHSNLQVDIVNNLLFYFNLKSMVNLDTSLQIYHQHYKICNSIGLTSLPTPLWASGKSSQLV